MSEIIPNPSSQAQKTSQFRLFIQMMQDYFAKRYSDISSWTLLLMVIGIIYMVSPIDIIPDVPVLGYIDDAVVLGFVLKQVSKEIKKYQTWKNTINS